MELMGYVDNTGSYYSAKTQKKIKDDIWQKKRELTEEDDEDPSGW